MTIGIFTAGEITPGSAVTTAIKKIDMTIAADNGAKNALFYHCFPQFTVGDFDSLDKKTRIVLEKNNGKLITYPSEKNETDTQLAIDVAIQQHATDIILFGALKGDRLDHILANIFLAQNQTVPLIFVDGETTVSMHQGPQTLHLSGKKNDLLSLLPLTPTVENILTKNLYYPLKNETLFAGTTRGISNVFLTKQVEISFTKGTLLVIHVSKE